jgi:hypothetical protein
VGFLKILFCFVVFETESFYAAHTALKLLILLLQPLECWDDKCGFLINKAQKLSTTKFLDYFCPGSLQSNILIKFEVAQIIWLWAHASYDRASNFPKYKSVFWGGGVLWVVDVRAGREKGCYHIMEIKFLGLWHSCGYQIPKLPLISNHANPF